MTTTREKKSKADPYQLITNEMTDLIERSPEVPWKTMRASGVLPTNLQTKKECQGFNKLFLMMKNEPNPQYVKTVQESVASQIIRPTRIGVNAMDNLSPFTQSNTEELIRFYSKYESQKEYQFCHSLAAVELSAPFF